MTKIAAFEYYDYKAFLLALESQRWCKGFRSRLAEFTGCQNAFISQVLNGDVNFSLEQALKIAKFLSLPPDQEQYFLWMVEYKRAGTTELKKYFHQMLDHLREKNLEISERIQIPQVLSSEAQTLYYSSWIYMAVHMIARISKFNSAAKIAQALEISEAKTNETIEFLINNGLLKRRGNAFESGNIQIHLHSDAANINKHHTNWRIESLKSLDAPQKSDLHYSGVSTLSVADVEKIRIQLVDFIENYIRTIEPSGEETLCALNLDFFRILKTG